MSVANGWAECCFRQGRGLDFSVVAIRCVAQRHTVFAVAGGQRAGAVTGATFTGLFAIGVVACIRTAILCATHRGAVALVCAVHTAAIGMESFAMGIGEVRGTGGRCCLAGDDQQQSQQHCADQPLAHGIILIIMVFIECIECQKAVQ